MYYGPALMDGLLGYSPFTPDWYFGLYYATTDPMADIAEAEIERTALPLMEQTASSTTSVTYSNAVDFLVGPLDACSVGGWFLANGETEADILWVSAFASPVTVLQGNYARFAVSTVNITLANL